MRVCAPRRLGGSLLRGERSADVANGQDAGRTPGDARRMIKFLLALCGSLAVRHLLPVGGDWAVLPVKLDRAAPAYRAGWSWPGRLRLAEATFHVKRPRSFRRNHDAAFQPSASARPKSLRRSTAHPEMPTSSRGPSHPRDAPCDVRNDEARASHRRALSHASPGRDE
jgi:hypothetical protein